MRKGQGPTLIFSRAVLFTFQVLSEDRPHSILTMFAQVDIIDRYTSLRLFEKWQYLKSTNLVQHFHEKSRHTFAIRINILYNKVRKDEVNIFKSRQKMRRTRIECRKRKYFKILFFKLVITCIFFLVIFFSWLLSFCTRKTVPR